MPDSLAALAVDVTPVRQQQPELTHRNASTASSGRLRQAFENDLVLGYLDLAEALAGRFEARGRERADLNQVAYLGLVKAARGFDQSKGESFPAYAAPTITGELKRYLRDRTWVVRPPRHIQDLRTRMFRAEPELTQALGRNPSVEELAGELGTDPAEVQEAISASSSMHPDSLDAVNPHSDAPTIGELLACPDTPLERLEELACLRDAMQDLDAEDRELLYRRYFCEETQVQLGKRLGMSQMQVSRRLARVLVELQRRLESSSRLGGTGDDHNGGGEARLSAGAGRAAGSTGSCRSVRSVNARAADDVPVRRIGARARTR
ncbi:sigma-70 family RNA polymerase sigma factor [Arthrobacter sp. P2b]|uniref:sigma-70 family RNA polymerase sigma factor n=1 Tax=Arthrobacter sp. P2b TaxID=1938741 RepID=UPI0009A787EA|nr:sigma-70 family RNA polymerase sigma factor [Arthrobacter sp. P2b]SLK11472.1 RNA polymerase sigma-B factor [Arthrobacter sp. P2b]